MQREGRGIRKKSKAMSLTQAFILTSASLEYPMEPQFKDPQEIPHSRLLDIDK